MHLQCIALKISLHCSLHEHWSVQSARDVSARSQQLREQIGLLSCESDRGRSSAGYLRKQAAGEEGGRPETLTGGSCTDLRRDGGT